VLFLNRSFINDFRQLYLQFSLNVGDHRPVGRDPKSFFRSVYLVRDLFWPLPEIFLVAIIYHVAVNDRDLKKFRVGTQIKRSEKFFLGRDR
jgi:hypothetical protein